MSKKTVFTIVALLGSYLVLQAVAEVAAAKQVQLGSIVMPAGTFVFAVTFTLRDMLHKRLGKTWAQAAIVVAAVMNLIQAGYLQLAARMQPAVFFQYNDAFTGLFSIVPSITIGSIIAATVGELIDTEVYHFWAHKFSGLPQFTRVLVSNAVSLPIDSAVFGLLAFTILPPLFGAKASPVAVALSLTAGQIVYKGIVTLVSLPGIYLVKERPLVDPNAEL